MPFTREDIRQIMYLLAPIKTRVANTVARAVVQVVDEAKKLQLLQVGILDGEDGEGAENFQGYGFKSVPKPGAEAVMVFPNGDRGVPLVVATEDRRHRPTGWKPGESGLYNDKDLIIRLKDDGTIEVGTIGGTFKSLAYKSDVDALATHVDGHGHTITSGSSLGQTSPPSTAPATPDLSPSAVGTSKLFGE